LITWYNTCNCYPALENFINIFVNMILRKVFAFRFLYNNIFIKIFYIPKSRKYKILRELGL